MILSFGRSCESTRPTGSRFTFTTIKSSMFRSLKIFSASTASASSRMQTGRARHHLFQRLPQAA